MSVDFGAEIFYILAQVFPNYTFSMNFWKTPCMHGSQHSLLQQNKPIHYVFEELSTKCLNDTLKLCEKGLCVLLFHEAR